jgi:MFS transporter, DHA2 family, multidrug resistance protein
MEPVISESTHFAYEGGDRLIAGIVLAVLTFWLFAQAMLNVVPSMRADLKIDPELGDFAVSATTLFSGIFIVAAGRLADRFGRVKMTYAGLAMNIVGSLLIAASPRGTAIALISGRIIQGLSGACIMPATLALMKAYYIGTRRQRALSFWSIGSWGGSALCPLLGGVFDETMGWRSIFWISAAVALVGGLLIRGTPESRSNVDDIAPPFDRTGLATFSIATICVSVVIAQAPTLGALHPAVLALTGAAAMATIVFIHTALQCSHPLVDVRLFRNATFLAATLSNFLLNGVAGALLIVSLLLQQIEGLSSLQSGLVTAGYLIAILTTIRMGEKLQQRWNSASRPMLTGCVATGLGILLTTFTYLPTDIYIGAASIGFTLVGVGLGTYATPSTDAALSDVPNARIAEASGIYKMASSLGNAFGIAASAAIFTSLRSADGPAASLLRMSETDRTRLAAALALGFNLALVIAAIFAVRLGTRREAGTSFDATRRWCRIRLTGKRNRQTM